MAFPKISSLALMALLFVAAASSANAQLLPQRNSVTVFGIVTCTLSPLPRRRLVGVNVFVSCDGGRTALAPPAPADELVGLFTITVEGVNATLVNSDRCAAYVASDVPGCPALRPGEILKGPFIELSRSVPVFAVLRTFVTSFFSVTRIG